MLPPLLGKSCEAIPHKLWEKFCGVDSRNYMRKWTGEGLLCYRFPTTVEENGKKRTVFVGTRDATLEDARFLIEALNRLEQEKDHPPINNLGQFSNMLNALQYDRTPTSAGMGQDNFPATT